MTPIIDVHTHIFNAVDIPLEGYLLSRRSETKRMEELLSFLGPILHRHIAEVMRDRCVARNLGKGEMGYLYKKMLWLASKLYHEEYFQWEETLSKDVESIAEEMIETFNDVHLFVPLMIDFEYWFKNTHDTPIREQVEFVYKNIVIPHKGRIHPFIPFDPARELARGKLYNPDGEPETRGSLRLVKDAVEKYGFIGVKLYNALGYKPIDNVQVNLHRRRVGVRNEKMKYLFRGEEYDKVLTELYDYCVKNEVPITAHCQIGGIESYPDASLHFGDAKFWRLVLDMPKYKDLRLNLAHFGWNQQPNRGYGMPQNWAKDICEMMIDYEHLYADVSHHRVTLANERRRFESGYKAMRNDFGEDIEKIKKKLLYGSDWHVLKRIKNYRHFKEKYIEVLKHDNFFFEKEIDDFLGGNALNFLGLRPGGKNRERLKKFYRKHAIAAPGWFKETA